MAAASSSLTAEMLAELEVPHEVSLSPSAKHVVYTLRSDWNRPRGRWASSLWIAEVGKQGSARPITRGHSNDMWPQFSPDGNLIAFLSDRASEGVMSIWTMDLSGCNVIPLTPTDNEKGVSNFAWSGDGKYIAYLSTDEKTTERKAKDEQKDDAMVYGEEWEYARLRVVEVTTKTITTLVADACHVYNLAWSPDSKSLAYATQRTPEGQSANINGTSIKAVRLDDQHATKLQHFPGLLEDLLWLGTNLWWRAMYTPSNILSAKSVYKMSLSDKTWSRHGFGEVDCASTWAMPPGLRKMSEDRLVVQVLSGLADQLHILPEGAILYDELHEVKGWDAVSKDGNTILTLVKSSASTPPEVYSIFAGNEVCLSDHGKSIAQIGIGTAEPFYAKAEDGTDLDGVLVIPRNCDLPKPWPTLVVVHGGPYQRVSCGFDLPYFNWSAWFASLGYAVLCVNYRGGSSHGEKHADLRQAAGSTDYSDMIELVKAGIDRGIIDRDRVGIAGWSYGGYLAFLAVTRNSTFHFQAAMCGAGISDWDLVIMTAEDPLWASQMAGHAPWEVDRSNTKSRQGSAIWHMQDIATPILILHGENDQNVPVSQSRAFHQGCVHRGVPCELVVYPREGHGMFPPFERAHYIDMLERMKKFYGKHLLRND